MANWKRILLIVWDIFLILIFILGLFLEKSDDLFLAKMGVIIIIVTPFVLAATLFKFQTKEDGIKIREANRETVRFVPNFLLIGSLIFGSLMIYKGIVRTNSVGVFIGTAFILVGITVYFIMIDIKNRSTKHKKKVKRLQ